MSWDDEIKSIKTRTLFVFFGKVLVGFGLWYLLALGLAIIAAVFIAAIVT